MDPTVGLALSDLLRVYHREVDKDFLRVFGRDRFSKAIDKPFTTKAKAIFDHHDRDGDGFLNRIEMNAFTLATEDEQEALDDAQWRKVCADMVRGRYVVGSVLLLLFGMGISVVIVWNGDQCCCCCSEW